MVIQETYVPHVLSATGQVVNGTGMLGGFLCSTAGALQLRDGGSTGTIIVATFPVTAGVFHSLPFQFSNGLYAELTGGATGTFGTV